MLSDEELIELAKRGWLPAPGETEERFLSRIAKGEATPTYFEEVPERKNLLQKGSSITQKIFGFTVDWVGIVFSNRKMSFMEGAAAWIFEEKKGDPKEVFLQFRKGLKGKEFLYRYYPLKELVAHELVHVARMAYEEPLFEEMLAYETSNSAFRRAFGPLFRQPKEMNLFIFTLIFPLFGTFLPYLWVIPLLTFFGFLIRLFYHRRLFEKKKKEVMQHVKGPHQGLFLLALSDEDFLEKGLPSPEGASSRERLLRALKL